MSGSAYGFEPGSRRKARGRGPGWRGGGRGDGEMGRGWSCGESGWRGRGRRRHKMKGGSTRRVRQGTSPSERRRQRRERVGVGAIPWGTEGSRRLEAISSTTRERRKRRRWTVNRSPHGNKTARDQRGMDGWARSVGVTSFTSRGVGQGKGRQVVRTTGRRTPRWNGR